MPPPPAARPTIYDVASRAGVSKSLVSLVLQGSPRVSEERRRAVQQAIAELGYRPSQAAASLAAHRTRHLGVVVDDFENLWFVDLLRGIRDALSGTGYHVSVADRFLNSHLGQGPLDGFLAAGVEGLVIAAELGPDGYAGLDVPVVVAGARNDVPGGVEVVTNDDRAGALLATRHLVGLGHTRIAHLTGQGGAAARRRAGYQEAMAAAGLEALVVNEDGVTSEAAGYAAASALLAGERSVTGIVAANDELAVGVLAAAEESGVRVPGDLSVVGYDNAPGSASPRVRLTTVDDRSSEVGATAAQVLLARIAEPDREVAARMLEPFLVERSSAGPPAAGP